MAGSLKAWATRQEDQVPTVTDNMMGCTCRMRSAREHETKRCRLESQEGGIKQNTILSTGSRITIGTLVSRQNHVEETATYFRWLPPPQFATSINTSTTDCANDTPHKQGHLGWIILRESYKLRCWQLLYKTQLRDTFQYHASSVILSTFCTTIISIRQAKTYCEKTVWETKLKQKMEWYCACTRCNTESWDKAFL